MAKILVVLLVVLLVVAGNANAQDEDVSASAMGAAITVEESVPANVALLFSVLLLAALVALTLIVRPALRQLADSAPPWMVEMMMTAAHYGLDAADRVAARTPAKYDDELIAELRRSIDVLKDEVAQLRSGDRPATGSS